ncbi:VOC family protein [Actinopolymorpha alba]|uniref:VOC family protein n=1 Tax=Actinopolymorpha alba TaxID=533267 RepID=UPI001ED99F80|nr:VOC family protein [Actinopolymorpha alba]
MSDSAPVVTGGPYPVLDCLHPRELATFYRELLGWQVADDDAGDDDPGWVGLRSPDGQRMISFQREARYEPPTWPADGTHQLCYPDALAATGRRAGMYRSRRPRVLSVRVALPPAR